MIDEEIRLYQEETGLRQELAKARAILIDALIVAGGRGQHSDHCLGAQFARHNQHCPPSHPVWKSAPKCDCWLGASAEFLSNACACGNPSCDTNQGRSRDI